MKYRHVGLLSIGHLATDINQGALPAMLPFFMAAYDLSYAAAAGIVFAANITSCIVQPLFGHAADRFSKPWLLSIGLILAGMGLGLTGMLQSYRWTMILAVVSGIGIAAYHPEAARLVNFAAGTKKGAAMSLFGVGGTMGFAIGPLLITTALLQWGLKGSLILIVPVTIVSLVMASQFSEFEFLETNRNRKLSESGDRAYKENWGAFGLLTITVIGKSILFYGLNTFIPIYWINALNQSKATGAMALTIFAGSGIFGTLLGGSLADRMGQKKVILLGCCGLTLFLPMLILFKDVQLVTLLLIPIGLMISATYSPTVVLGQNYLPNRVGLSSGVTLGLSVAIGGGAAPLIGKIADIYGIWYSLASIAFLPIFITAVALSLPASPNIIAQIDADKP
jgi:FSR family fosmidomycin resistance protein-like MFS transporter